MLRSGRLSLGPTIDRFEELFAERVGAPYAAARLERHGRSPPALPHRRARARRRGDHVAVLVRRVGELLHLRGRDAGVRGRRPADAEPRPGGGRGRDHPAHAGDRRRRHLRLPCELDELRAICDRHGLALIEDSCEALGAEYKGGRSARTARRRSSRFYPNKQMTTGEGGVVVTHSEEEWQLLRSLATRAALDAGRLARARPARLQLPLDGRAGGARDRAAREARPAPRLRSDGGSALRRAARGRRRRRAAVRRRRRPPALVVRLCRPAGRGDRPRARDRRAAPRRGSRPRTTSRRSTCSRTCASASASREGMLPGLRGREPRGRSRSRSSRSSRPRTRSASSRRSERRSSRLWADRRRTGTGKSPIVAPAPLSSTARGGGFCPRPSGAGANSPHVVNI